MRDSPRTSAHRARLSWPQAAPWLLSAGLAAATFVACGPPSSFDFLTGGPPLDDGGSDAPPPPLVEDSEIAPPRALGPLAGSWVNGGRPHFRWEATGGGTGARIEICRTNTCDGEKKTFDAQNAASADLPEELSLAPGMWFWRLATLTPSTFGKKSSPVWSLLVRGKPAHAGQDQPYPAGTVVDVNGDGRPDLLIALEFQLPGSQDRSHELWVFYGLSDPTRFDLIPETLTSGAITALTGLASSDVSIATVDANGDGFSDIVVPWGEAASPQLLFLPGRAKGFSSDEITSIATPPLTELPNLHTAADVDGDGWGDILVGTKTSAFTLYGTPRGPGPLQSLAFINPPPLDAGTNDGGLPPMQPPPTAPLAVHGGFARNRDAFADLAVAEPFEKAPMFLQLGAARREYEGVYFDSFTDRDLPTRALAFASGDFDGDGLTEVAFFTDDSGAPKVCVLKASVEFPSKGDLDCWAPAPVPAGFATSLAAADLDGDGRDELLVGSSSSGIWVVKRESSGLVAEPIATPFGQTITIVDPGRPTPAIWASSRADRSEIAIFRGREQASRIGVDEYADYGVVHLGPALR